MLIFQLNLYLLNLLQDVQSKFTMFPKPPQTQQVADFKKKRDNQLDLMRRNNRQQRFKKHRNLLSGAQRNNLQVETPKKDRLLIVDQRYRKDIEVFLRSTYNMNLFGQLITSITEGNIINQHYGMIGIRKILSIAENPPIQAVIDAGLVPKMIQYVKQTQYPQLQLQATWALTNVASGTTIQCQSIIDKGGIPLFVDLLRSNNLGIVEQAIWAIGNISSDCVFYRDTIVRAGGLINLVQVTKRLSDQTLIKHCCWALSNLCRGSPLPKYDQIKFAIPVLCAAIAQGKINDKEIISDCCWAISYHSDANRNKIQAVIESGVIYKIIQNLQEPTMGLLIPSIRILGNISSGSVEQANQLLKSGILLPLEKVLQHSKKVVRRQACWVISNLTAGSRNQVQQILARQSLIKRVLQLFQSDGNDVRREICYIFSNMSHSGEPETIFNIYKATNIIRYYINLLSVDDTKTIQVSLQCLFIVLGHGQKFKGKDRNPLVVQLYSLGAVDILQKLQYHKSDLVYENVSKILQTFFQIQDPLEL